MRLPLIYKRTGPQSGSFFMFLFLLPIFPFLPWYCIFPRTLAIKAELSQPWMKSCISKVCYTVLKGDVGISVDFCQHLQITDVGHFTGFTFSSFSLQLPDIWGSDWRLELILNKCKDGDSWNGCSWNGIKIFYPWSLVIMRKMLTDMF